MESDSDRVSLLELRLNEGAVRQTPLRDEEPRLLLREKCEDGDQSSVLPVPVCYFKVRINPPPQK